MKLSGGLILSALSCAAHAANTGHVFVFDPVQARTAPQSPAEVSPETARLILAQRLGLSRFHSLESADDRVLDQINAYGGRQRFFHDRSQAHTLVWIEDAEDVRGRHMYPDGGCKLLTEGPAIIKNQKAYSADFTISNPPAIADNDQLMQDLIAQAKTLPKKPDPSQLTYLAGIEAEVAFEKIKNAETYNGFLSVVRADMSDDGSVAELSKALDAILQKSVSAGEKGWPVTVVLMPPASSRSKRTAHPYGLYEMPSASRQRTEAILSASSFEPPRESQNVGFSTSQQAGNTTQVLGILPAFFKDLKECQEKTHNCSGHGECKLLHKGTQGGRADRYGCACKPDIVHVGKDTGMETHRQITYWGGPACQKRDISTPFWLFVGTGVLLAFLISAGIGLMYSMGSEELPSVIGAGVSGPTRK